MLVAGMEEEKVRAIASESADIRSERMALKQKLEDLKHGKRILNIHACDKRSSERPKMRLPYPEPKVQEGMKHERMASRSPRANTASSRPRTPPPEISDDSEG